jgi:hypothetical protein
MSDASARPGHGAVLSYVLIGQACAAFGCAADADRAHNPVDSQHAVPTSQELRMKNTGFLLSRSMRVLYVGAAAWMNAPVLAASDVVTADAAARYQRERAACNNGQSSQERATCLREASAAHAQMRKNGVQDHDMAFEQNAQKRCQALPNEDRSACLARMQGQGSTSGSVSAGGIYRELVTTETAPTAAKRAAEVPLVAPK